MAHMSPEIARFRMAHVETTEGTEVVPLFVLVSTDREATFRPTRDDVSPFVNGTPTDDPEVKEGWYARFNASGYLDSTDWTGPYDTEEEATREFCNLHGICETCHEDHWDCDCESEDEDGEDDGESRLYGPEPLETAPVTCRLCGDPRCDGH